MVLAMRESRVGRFFGLPEVSVAGLSPYSPGSPNRMSLSVRASLAVLSLVGMLLVALPASASCGYGATIGWGTVGSTIKGGMAVNCVGETVTYARIRLQEKYVGVWYTRYWSEWSGNAAGVSALIEGSCAGHGQDYWRAQGYHQTNLGSSATYYSPSSAGTTFNCP